MEGIVKWQNEVTTIKLCLQKNADLLLELLLYLNGTLDHKVRSN